MSTDSNQISAIGLEELKAELAHLEGTRRKEIAERIKIARDFGDLKENSEYHDAKNEQAFLETKIMRLRERLTQAVVTKDEQNVVKSFRNIEKVVVTSPGELEVTALVWARSVLVTQDALDLVKAKAS